MIAMISRQTPTPSTTIQDTGFITPSQQFRQMSGGRGDTGGRLSTRLVDRQKVRQSNATS